MALYSHPFRMAMATKEANGEGGIAEMSRRTMQHTLCIGVEAYSFEIILVEPAMYTCQRLNCGDVG